ncbi:MAG: GNAT family N-acetyltransferase, partial [Candidatus Eremiobacteraeota bacterium]|nr:GNAT family N-acetyltransferase [Candidatus Eremiobacteraeota bacterium]
MEPLDERHAAALFDGFADGEVYRFIPSEPPATAETLAARYRRTAAGPPATSERWWNWAVFRSGERSRALGTVELSLFEGGQNALLAYVFARFAWGSGYATEACGAALTY